ncbi:Holliday junction ATP-dependent DNA helicase RuvA [Candidatus Hepatincola sp. Av]
MFAKLSGIISYIDEDNLIIDVNGVGYLVYVPSSILQIESLNNPINLFIQTLVKEDSITLYGFQDLALKRMFNLLMSVQGVGAKLALTIVSALPVQNLQSAILQNDINLLKSVNGVGAKVAQRLVGELKDKITKVFNLQDSIAPNFSIPNANNSMNDVIAALKGLGYNPFEINKIMPNLQSMELPNSSTETLLKQALKLITQDTN